MATIKPPAVEPSIRTVAMPADANANGDIFGGWVLSQMDIAGGTFSQGIARGRTATVAIDAMTFHSPVAIGDELSVYCQLVKIGRTSIRVQIEAWARARPAQTPMRVTEGEFVFVAIDDLGRPRTVPQAPTET